MANDLTKNPWVCDSDGVLSIKPIFIKNVRLDPAAASDVATLTHWDWESTKSTAVLATVTVSTGATITSTGNFTTAKVAEGDVIKISSTSTGNNLGTYLVKTRSSDNAIVIDDAGLTNEATKLYNFEIHTGVTFRPFQVGDAGALQPDDFNPAHPVTVQNLALDGLSSSAVMYIYV